MSGSDGPPGPITEPPALTALSPRWGSGNTQVTITGTGFSTTAADNHVFFDGNAATVISATATQLVVTPDVATDSATDVVVDVEVSNQVSNGLLFELVASGTARHLGVPLPTAPTSVVVVGTDIYIASGVNGAARTGGLFKLSTTGVVTQVVPGKLVTLAPNGTPIEIVDGPVALATFNGNVYFTTTFGSVRKYTVATGEVTDVLAIGNVGAGTEFPSRTGIAFDTGGDMYVVDRNLPGIIRLRANQTLATIMNAAFDGIYGIASDGTNLFVSDEQDFTVHRVDNLAGTPGVTLLATDIAPLRGITVDATNVIVSTDIGELLTVSKSAPGAFAFVANSDTAGYLYGATGLGLIGNDILLAQPGGSAVRRKPAADAEAAIVAAGVRIALSTAQIGSSWYVGTVGSDILQNGPSTTQPDGAVIEITPTGSRVLATTFTPTGIVASGATQITVADCIDGRIFAVTTTTAAQMDLIANFSTTCPSGLAADANAVYYVESGADSIGKLVGTTDTPDFVTGLDPDASQVVVAGTKLVTAGVFDPAPLQQAPVATGGAATTLVPAAVFSQGTLAAAADGTLYGMRTFSGELVTIDTTAGVVTAVGSATPPGRPITGSLTAAILVGADHTVTLMDVLQGDLVSIAP